MASLMVNDCVPHQERKLAEHAEAEAKAALEAKAAVAALAASAAKDAAVQLATDSASEAAKKLRASQKKLRQATELLEQKAAGAELNKDQRDKIKTIPTLEAELQEIMISATELENLGLERWDRLDLVALVLVELGSRRLLLEQLCRLP